MKKIILLMLFASLGWQHMLAQDFIYDGLAYNITSTTTVEVADQNGFAEGDIVIPSQVTNDNVLYSVTYIADNAFNDCGNLNSVIIPNSVTNIGYAAFVFCFGLTSITLPNSITSIGDYAFYNCPLTLITCNIATPLSINAYVFNGVNQSACSLTVPVGSVAAYQAANVWKNFDPITAACTPTDNTTTVSACSSYTWAINNQTYTTSGVYTGTTTNCVTEKLDLTLNVGCDTTSPTLVISSTSTNPTNANTIPITFTFSEAVTGFTASDIFAAGGSLSSFSGSGSIYTATLTPSGDGSIALFVFQGVCTDLAGNPNVFTSFSITSDRTLPSVVISSTETSPTSTSPIPITISFSEAVTGFDITDITSTRGILNDFSGSGANYTVNLYPTGSNGTRRINIATNTAIDAAGNNNTAAAQFSITYIAPCSTPTTWNGYFWTNGEPVANQPAIIAADFTADSNLSACSLLVGNNAIVSVPSGINFTISGNVTVQAGSSVTFENNANLIQSGTTNGNSGNITIKRDSNTLKRLDYTLWSSPVTGTQTLGDFSSYTTPTRFYTYNATIDKYTAATASNPFEVGTGYLIRMPDQNPGSLGLTTPYYLGTETLIYTGAFTGKPNNGTIDLTGLASDKYYAIGNPYPSTISADAFLNGNATDGTLYFWRKTNATPGTAYATYTLAGGTGTAAGT
ncbi:Ig-like domain-containing protein, partial [Flavobacterium sp.]|uniref:Ig-like domain-containing protein n=1 Tax=Flavobacterium sp. TaxID=239 RepID=UPI00286E4B93